MGRADRSLRGARCPFASLVSGACADDPGDRPGLIPPGSLPQPSLARLVYSLLKHGEQYVARSMEEYQSEHRERQVRALCRKAHELGFELVKPQELAPDPMAERSASSGS